jgi:hypothetical protein
VLNTSGDHYSQDALTFKSLIQKQFEAWSESLLALSSFCSQDYLKWFPQFIFDLYQALKTWRVQLQEALQYVTNLPNIINDLKQYFKTQCAAWYSDLQRYRISIPESDKGDAVDMCMMISEFGGQLLLALEYVDSFPHTMALKDHIEGRCSSWTLQMREILSSLGQYSSTLEMDEHTADFTSMLDQLQESTLLDWVEKVAADEL